MHNILETLHSLDWESVYNSLNQKGYARLANIIPVNERRALIAGYDSPNLYRKTIRMERYRFGAGEYKYFKTPLPDLITSIRSAAYEKLAPLANQWITASGKPAYYPPKHDAFIQQCRNEGQIHPTALILKYGCGDFNTLHQDLYGEVYFPFQMVVALSEPEVDYEGGEFVLTQQNPRAQSQAIVLRPKAGDILIIPTHSRHVKGMNGYHRVDMRHGVSEVHSGSRYTLGIIFHDAEH